MIIRFTKHIHSRPNQSGVFEINNNGVLTLKNNIMPTIAGQTTTWNVFHYTDLNALINIVHKDCIVLRATNVGAPDKPCGVGCADANPKTMLPNDT